MAPIRKHGGHRQNLNSFTTAAGTAGTPEIFTYDAYAGPQSSATASGGIDSTIEAITEAVLVLGTTLTGQATNFTTFRLRQINAAGSTVNDIRVSYSAAGVTSTAFVPIDLAVASGATVPGAGTGTLTVNTGSALPWSLNNGDSIVLDSVVAGTGQYVGVWEVTFLVGAKGA